MLDAELRQSEIGQCGRLGLVFAVITIAGNDEEVRVTIPRSDLSPEQLEAVLRPFRFAGAVAASQMSRKEAMLIAEESKGDWWEKNKLRFIPGE